MLPLFLSLSVLLFFAHGPAPQIAEPSTTLKAETANNTSARRGLSEANAAPGHVSKIPLKNLLYPGMSAPILARVVPFFLSTQKHVDVGYSSDDPEQARRQVEDMLSRGIDGAIVDWYGTENPDLGETARLYKKQSEQHSGFTFAISEDKGALKHCVKRPRCDVTQLLIHDLNYAYENFEHSPAYMVHNGRPVVFFFDVNLDPIDWSAVRQGVEGNPLFVFRNVKAFHMPQSEGAFSWVDHTGNRSLPYLDEFYKKSGQRPSGSLNIASVYKGFDDRAASWSENRVTPQECGQLWLDTFSRVNQYFSQSHPVDALQIVTWNDYEEGTEIESGIDDCVEVQPAISGSTLGWTATGNTNAVDHYNVFASTDQNQLTLLSEVPPDSPRFDLASAGLPAGRYQIFVQAVGKPGILDKMSPGISWESGPK